MQPDPVIMFEKTGFYLLFSFGGAATPTASDVFYRVETEALAKYLCKALASEKFDEYFHKEFFKENDAVNGWPAVFCVAAATLPPEEQLDYDGELGRFMCFRSGLRNADCPGLGDPPPPEVMKARMLYWAGARDLERQVRDLEQKLWPYNPEAKQEEKPAPSTPAEKAIEPPEEDWRNAGLNMLWLFAQAYYNMLKSVIGSPCETLDLEMNTAYLVTVKYLKRLLKIHADLQGFPLSFEPAVANLCPSTIREIKWKDIAQGVDHFLSMVHEYVGTKEMCEPAPGSLAWFFVEVFRPQANAAIEKAMAYRKNMTKRVRKHPDALPHLASLAKPVGTPSEKGTFYLFESPAGSRVQTAATVFYKVEGELIAKLLCSLFATEYGEKGPLTFHCAAAATLSPADQVLLDEALDTINSYIDPDSHGYDPAPIKKVFARAQHGGRAQDWDRRLWEKITPAEPDRHQEPLPFPVQPTREAAHVSPAGYAGPQKAAVKETQAATKIADTRNQGRRQRFRPLSDDFGTVELDGGMIDLQGREKAKAFLRLLWDNGAKCRSKAICIEKRFGNPSSLFRPGGKFIRQDDGTDKFVVNPQGQAIHRVYKNAVGIVPSAKKGSGATKYYLKVFKDSAIS
jgi:hypothetical protein